MKRTKNLVKKSLLYSIYSLIIALLCVLIVAKANFSQEAQVVIYIVTLLGFIIHAWVFHISEQLEIIKQRIEKP